MLDDILNVRDVMTSSAQGGMSQMGQQGGWEPRRRPPKPGYTPVDLEKLAIIEKYANMGLGPEYLAPILDQVMGGLDERTTMYQGKMADRRATRQEAMANLPGMAGQAFEMSQAGMDPSAIETAFSGVKGPAGNKLADIIGSLGGGGAAPAIPDEERAGIFQKASELAGSGVPLHQARIQMVGQVRALGGDPAQVEETYDLIGQAYSSSIPAGGGARASQINAPLTFDQYQGQQQIQPEVSGARSGGGLGGLEQLMGQKAPGAVIGNDTRDYYPASVGGLYERWFENLPGWWPGSPNG